MLEKDEYHGKKDEYYKKRTDAIKRRTDVMSLTFILRIRPSRNKTIPAKIGLGALFCVHPYYGFRSHVNRFAGLLNC